MSLSKVVKAAGVATGNPILMTAGQIGELLGFRARSVKKGKKSGKKRKAMTNNAKRSKAKRARKGKGVSSFGAPIVQTVNAPVAFARAGEIKPFFNIRPSTEVDGIIVHSVDSVTTLTSSATPNTYAGLFSSAVNPTSTTLFPYLASTVAPGYQKFKLRMLRLHYVHFCPTSVAGTIYLWYNPDALASTPASSATLTNDSNSAQGSLYEDVRLEVDLKGLTEDWQFVGTTSTDNRMNSAGLILAAVENMPATTGFGNLYIETVWEFIQRKLPAQNEPVALLRKICAGSAPAVQKRELLHRLVDAIPLDMPTERKEQSEEEVLAKAFAKLGVALPRCDGARTPCSKQLGYDRV